MSGFERHGFTQLKWFNAFRHDPSYRAIMSVRRSMLPVNRKETKWREEMSRRVNAQLRR